MNSKEKWAEIIFLGFWLILICYYLYDNYQASSSIDNQIFILPIGIVTLILISLVFWQLIKEKSAIASKEIKDKKENEKSHLKTIMLSMLLFLIYALLITFIGFDLATFVFVLLMLVIQGERRLKILIVFPIIFAFISSQFFYVFTSYPMPMLIEINMLDNIF
jgi:hypothetical protein